MNHPVSLIHVDNSEIQRAIAEKRHPDIIAKMKAGVAFSCVYGFEYHEVPFEDLGNLLSADVGFNNFKFKDASVATYDKEKHPDAYGLVRGVSNIASGCSWLCLDVDESTLKDTEMHNILSNINHHVARTSNPDNPYKMRVIIELTHMVHPTRELWKYFIVALASNLGIGTIDKIPMSQVIFGYEGREVLSVTDKQKVDPEPFLKIAKMRWTEYEEKRALAYQDPGHCSRALETPYTTFDFAYNATVGNRWASSHAAIHKAKELGASREYIVDLMYHINDFLDHPKPRSVVEATLISAI